MSEWFVLLIVFFVTLILYLALKKPPPLPPTQDSSMKWLVEILGAVITYGAL